MMVRLLYHHCKLFAVLCSLTFQGLAMVMHKNHEEESVFDMLNQALELASRERRVTEERNIKILIAQMHLIKVITLYVSALLSQFIAKYSIITFL